MSFLDDLSEGVKKAAFGFSSIVKDKTPETLSMFSRYLDEDNDDDYAYPISKLRKSKTVEEGEKINQERLLNALTRPILRKKQFQSFVTNKYQPGFYRLNDMRDGEIFGLEDYNDVDNKGANITEKGDWDLSKSLGSFKLRSKSNLQFRKSKNVILPYGYVEHNINDVYDFHPEAGYISAFAKKLEDRGSAKNFPVKARWKTQPFGVIKLKDDKVDQTGIIWDLLNQ